MMPVHRARVTFWDGTVLEIVGDVYPDDAPRTGIEVIVYEHAPPYRTVAHGQDTYRWLHDPSGVLLISGPPLPDDEWPGFLARALG